MTTRIDLNLSGPLEAQVLAVVGVRTAQGESGAGRDASAARSRAVKDLTRAGSRLRELGVLAPDGRGREPEWRTEIEGVEYSLWLTSSDYATLRLVDDDWNLSIDLLDEWMAPEEPANLNAAQSWALSILRARAAEILGAVGLGGGL